METVVVTESDESAVPAVTESNDVALAAGAALATSAQADQEAAEASQLADVALEQSGAAIEQTWATADRVGQLETLLTGYGAALIAQGEQLTNLTDLMTAQAVLAAEQAKPDPEPVTKDEAPAKTGWYHKRVTK